MIRFIVIIILTGALYSCGVQHDLNGTWIYTQKSEPCQTSYVNNLPIPIDTSKITVESDTVKPILTRDTTSRRHRATAHRQKYLTISGRNLTLSYWPVNMTDSRIMFRKRYLGKYKRRNGQIIATFDKIESINTYDGSSSIANCEEFKMIFYYSKSTQTLYEKENDEKIIWYKNGKSAQENDNSRNLYCGGIKPVSKTYFPISTFEVESIINDADTMKIENVLCTDSINFSQVFNGIKVNTVCIEINAQGTTYYSIKINDEGKFENLKVLRKVDKCFDQLNRKIEIKLEDLNVLSKEYFNSELIFYHEFRVEKIE